MVAAFSLVFFLVLMLVGFYTYAQTETGGSAEFRYTFENSSYFNGMTFAIYAFYFAFLLLLPIFVATEGGAQIAGETASGTLFLLLTRPISRARIFFTKLAIGGLFAGTLTGGFLAGALLIGLVAVGWGDLDLYPGVLQMAESHQHIPQSTAILRFLIAWPAASLALCVPLALSFLISSWVDRPVNATGTSVALYLVMHVISSIHFFRDLRPFLFTSYMSYWRGLFREDVDWAAMGADAAKLAGFGLLFVATAFHRFRVREEA